MADRYANNQFYNFGNYESGIGNPNSRTDQDNPQFIWPSSVNKNAAVGPQGTVAVQRGYMKMITSAYGDSLSKDSNLHKRRLHFQFNPDTLTRAVNARNDIQQWQNQDPFQFTQPIPGDANFSFELLFNREAELASASYRNRNGALVKNNKAANVTRKATFGGGHPSRPVTTGFTDSPYDPSWVTDIGVLADIMVFDQIIGQGMNQDLIAAIVKKAGEVTAAYNLANPGGGTEDTADKEIPFDAAKTSTFLGTNIGNSAFLIAQPIRVVFSSTFMVEGFVTSTMVSFNKFNPSMVPTQCIVNVQMQAMYIGFANKDTYLTTLYKDFDASTAFGSGSNLASGTPAEIAALKSIGEDLVKGYAAGTAYAYESFDPFRILGDGKGGTNKFQINAIFSESTKTFVTKNKGTVSASLKIKMTYLGRTSGPPATNLAYAENGIAFEGLSRATLNMSNVGKGRDSIIFDVITNPEQGVSKSFDRASNAEYKVELTVYYDLVSASGSVRSSQVSIAEKKVMYDDSWIVGSALQGKDWSEDSRLARLE
jgi:hypothetical protein